MAITKSAKKALRTSLRKREFNLARRDKVEKAVKALKKAISEKKKKDALAEFKKVQQALDKAAKAHTITRNTASRRKSRLSKLIKKLEK